ncbi:MAG: dUTP diphosphatase [Cyanobacteria bacterium SIG30]|nr:dUTP diphosphatase [Cyanobacteria bacterium SIG30]
MDNTVLKIKKLENFVELPQYKSELASGMDLCAANNEDIVLKPMDRKLVPTGIQIELQKGFEAQIRPRSGLSIKNGITLINCVGTIDADYRGEVCVPLVNLSNDEFVVKRGDRIAQMVIAPVVFADIIVVENLSDTKRASGGFGSTGTN